MIVTYKDDVSTLDPAIGYDWQNWSMIKSLFDGLMDYKPGTTDAGARTSPRATRSRDGRPDLHLQAAPGRQVPQRPRADRRGREILDRPRRQPEDPEPRRRLLRLDQGLRGGRGGKAEALSGITVVDPYTVKFELSRPDATFLHVMAINFAHVVPKEEVEKYGADFGKNPVGTGAFKLAEWTLGQRVVFERNPDYWKHGPAQSRQDHLRDRPGADRGAAAPAEGRGRRARRRHPAGQVPRGEERPELQGPDRRGRPAAHRLRHA